MAYGLEQCDCCMIELEESQIGLCEDCQEGEEDGLDQPPA